MNALVIGASTGYGLASRIALTWAYGAKTLGLLYERPADSQTPLQRRVTITLLLSIDRRQRMGFLLIVLTETRFPMR